MTDEYINLYSSNEKHLSLLASATYCTLQYMYIQYNAFFERAPERLFTVFFWSKSPRKKP